MSYNYQLLEISAHKVTKIGRPEAPFETAQRKLQDLIDVIEVKSEVSFVRLYQHETSDTRIFIPAEPVLLKWGDDNDVKIVNIAHIKDSISLRYDEYDVYYHCDARDNDVKQLFFRDLEVAILYDEHYSKVA